MSPISQEERLAARLSCSIEASLDDISTTAVAPFCA